MEGMRQMLPSAELANYIAHDGRKNVWAPDVLYMNNVRLGPDEVGPNGYAETTFVYNERTWHLKVGPSMGCQARRQLYLRLDFFVFHLKLKN